MPSLRNSRHFFSLPCQCIRSKTLPLRRWPFRRLSVAGRILSMPRPCCSSHFFASPFHCRAVNALPLLLGAVPCLAQPLHALPLLCTAVPCLRLACLCFSVPLLRRALPLRCTRPHDALPLHSSSPHSLCFAPPCLAISKLGRAGLCLCCSVPCSSSPSLGQSTRINALAARNHSQPCHCHASSCTASANQGRQCHALALSPSPHRRCK